jgi:hypothetical protein
MFHDKNWPIDLPTCVPVNPIDVDTLRKMIEFVTPRLDAEPHRVRPGESLVCVLNTLS